MRSNWQTNTNLSVVFVALIDIRVSLMFKSTETFYQGFGQKLGAKPNLQIFDLNGLEILTQTSKSHSCHNVKQFEKFPKRSFLRDW